MGQGTYRKKQIQDSKVQRETDPWKMQGQTEEDMLVRSGPAELRSQRLRKGGF